MSTSLWPALLAAVLGGGSGGGGGSSRAGGVMEEQERTFNPVQALLYHSVLGEHALYWWIGIVCFVALGESTFCSLRFHHTPRNLQSAYIHQRILSTAREDGKMGSIRGVSRWQMKLMLPSKQPSSSHAAALQTFHSVLHLPLTQRAAVIHPFIHTFKSKQFQTTIFLDFESLHIR